VSKQFDRYDLAARLEKLGDRLMVACEKGEEIENRRRRVPHRDDAEGLED
jgi:hypothetical protein